MDDKSKLELLDKLQVKKSSKGEVQIALLDERYKITN